MTSTDTLGSLRAGFRGPLVMPADADYGAARAGWNAKAEKRPSTAVVVILCWSGDLDEGRDVIRPWLDLAPPIQVVDAMPYVIIPPPRSRP